MTPTARTLAKLRKLGVTAQVVERWNPYGGARKPDGTAVGNRVDLFGVIDVIVIGGREYSLVDPRCGIIGIQATSAANMSSRRRKSAAEPRLLEWLNAGGRFEVWGWRKKGSRWIVKREFAYMVGDQVCWQPIEDEHDS